MEMLQSRFNSFESFRQRQVMESAVAGLSSKEIATSSKISSKTVEYHCAWVMERWVGACKLPENSRGWRDANPAVVVGLLRVKLPTKRDVRVTHWRLSFRKAIPLQCARKIVQCPKDRSRRPLYRCNCFWSLTSA